MSNDDYTSIEIKVMVVTDKAVMVKDDVWIPFALMRWADEKTVREAMQSETVRVQVREWKLRDLGLIQ